MCQRTLFASLYFVEQISHSPEVVMRHTSAEGIGNDVPQLCGVVGTSITMLLFTTLRGQLKKWQGRKIPSHPFPGQTRIHLWVFFEKKVWCKKNAGISGWFLGVQNFASDPTAVTLGLPLLRWAYWPDQSPTSAMRPKKTEPGETIWDPGQVDPPIHPGGAEMEKHAPLPPS